MLFTVNFVILSIKSEKILFLIFVKTIAVANIQYQEQNYFVLDWNDLPCKKLLLMIYSHQETVKGFIV